jgi:putative integral membrane protein (TIGR02587 family)
VAFGASLAATVMTDPEDDGRDQGTSAARPPVGALGRLMVGAAGGLFFAFNIAPTDETLILAVGATPLQLLITVGVSLGVGLAIVFHAEFRGGRRPIVGKGPLDGAGGETLAAYATGLLIALLLLWAFGAADRAGAGFIVAQLVILGIVGAFGAAAARLLIGGPEEPEKA